MAAQPNQGFGLKSKFAPAPAFNPLELFKTSFTEVIKEKEEKRKQLYTNAQQSRMPDREYLNTKRSSVFHKAFESKDNVKNFEAPIFQKSQSDITALTELFSESFLTKHLDNE